MKKIKKDKVIIFIIQSRGYGKSFFEKYIKENENEKISNRKYFYYFN